MSTFQRIIAASVVLVALAATWALWSTSVRQRRVLVHQGNRLYYVDTWRGDICRVHPTEPNCFSIR